MRTTLVGYTGFVGGNLAASHPFDALYNSKNIADSFGRDNGLVVYSGMPAEKFLANADPEADLARARGALENIQAMRPEKLVLISTVDVYGTPAGVDEASAVDSVLAYGANRGQLEEWVREAYPDALILRLPGLYGKGLKKNFIYDMLTLVPGALTEAKYNELAGQTALVPACYAEGEGGFYRLRQDLDGSQRAELKAFFEANDFNALSFTDSRSVFQFYDLTRLWGDIGRCLQLGLTLVNLATEPVQAGAVYRQLFGREFVNRLDKPPVRYDMRTRYGRELGGSDEYVADRNEVMAGLARFAAGFENGQGGGAV